jgi:hypothetical protein
MEEGASVDNVIPMQGRHAPVKCKEDARFLANLVYEALPLLLPKASIDERRKLARDILSLCRGERARMTPEVLTDLLMVHSNCLMDQKRRCPLMISVRSLCWEVNRFCNLASEEDAGFKRHDPMLAARPLNRIFECLLEEEDQDGNV